MYRSVPVVGMMQDNITKLKTHIELDDTQRQLYIHVFMLRKRLI